MVETKREKRIRQLSELLLGEEKVHLKDAAESLNVSEMTIRRDFNEPNVLVSLIGGYVVKKQIGAAELEYVINEQSTNHVKEKAKIGQEAACLVFDNQTVFFDNGTTIVHIIQAISDEISFTGVCFSLNVFMALKNKPNCHVILCGGAYDSKHNNFYPLGDSSEIDNIRFDTAFLSAAGIDPAHGLTCYSFNELAYKKRAITQSQNVVLAIDNSKFGVVKSAFICSLNSVDIIISDIDIPAEYET
ncbi:DNA-binding transcriptional repressor DeoR [Photobacterium sanguinicancri]|uniref:DNA-binding transcriptional repressor DeoR n=1 Tax=Photobacterium sanguinicancri TaxID=875932 RepID=A0AAW7YAE0_9GAMM|nr:DNA-binding transcriptional repressor DeoR [Photobacterium sanguinicancri]MDO6544676.1 DNA-binding transcriptional repressor DeoR [Photobacterium sanguinicancri]